MEVHTPTGRVDIVMKTDKVLYLFELKLNIYQRSDSFICHDFPVADCSALGVEVDTHFNNGQA